MTDTNTTPGAVRGAATVAAAVRAELQLLQPDSSDPDVQRAHDLARRIDDQADQTDQGGGHVVAGLVHQLELILLAFSRPYWSGQTIPSELHRAMTHRSELLDACRRRVSRALAADDPPAPPRRDPRRPPPHPGRLPARPRRCGHREPPMTADTKNGPRLVDAVAQLVGLPGGTDPATVVDAVTEAVAEAADQRHADGGLPSGYVSVPASHLDELTATAAAGTDAARALHHQEREQFLDEHRLKYAPANRASWAAEYDRDPAATRELLANTPDLLTAADLDQQHDAPGAVDPAAVAADPNYQAWRF